MILSAKLIGIDVYVHHYVVCYQVKKSKSCLNASSSENIPWYRRAALSLPSLSRPLPQLYFSSLYIAATVASAKSLQSCLTLCDPIDSSPPGFPIPGILQARTLEWVHCTLPPNKIAISLFSRVPFEKVSFIRKETAFFSVTFQNLEQCLVVNEKHLWNGEWIFAMQWLSLCFTELKQFPSLNHTLIDSVTGTWPSDGNVHRLNTCYPSLPHHLPHRPKLHFCCTGWFWWTTFLSSSTQNLELISVLPSYSCPYFVNEFFFLWFYVLSWIDTSPSPRPASWDFLFSL